MASLTSCPPHAAPARPQHVIVPKFLRGGDDDDEEEKVEGEKKEGEGAKDEEAQVCGAKQGIAKDCRAHHRLRQCILRFGCPSPPTATVPRVGP